jgi:hypothetical protein
MVLTACLAVALMAGQAVRAESVVGAPIESALSVTRRLTGRVTRWRDGDMRRRWCVAGLLPAEGTFRRIEGDRTMPGLIRAPEVMTRGQPPGSERNVA